MRMVVEVSDELHGRLKKQAKVEGRPLSKVVREMAEDYLKHKVKKEEK